MDSTTKRIAINYGLIVSAVAVGYTLISYIVNEAWLSSQAGGIFMLLAMLVIPYFGVREFKRPTTDTPPFARRSRPTCFR